MTNAIAFLEMMGQDAALRLAAPEDVAVALTRTQVDAGLQAAILSGNRAQVEAHLGSVPSVCCILFPAEGDEDKEKEPSRDDDEISALSIGHGIASEA